MASHMMRTLQELRKKNINYWIVEAYHHYARKKVDLFNIFDVLALDNGIVGIQVCGSDIGVHKKKIMVEHAEYTKDWLKNGGQIEVWAWRKLKKIKNDGKKGKQAIWQPRIFDVLVFNDQLFWEEG